GNSVDERRAARGPRTELHNSGWHCRCLAIIGRVLFLCKQKTYYTSAESYVIYTNGCFTQRDCLTSGRARAFAVRVIPQGWEEPCVFPAIHKTGGATPITRGSPRPGGGNSGNR